MRGSLGESKGGGAGSRTRVRMESTESATCVVGHFRHVQGSDRQDTCTPARENLAARVPDSHAKPACFSYAPRGVTGRATPEGRPVGLSRQSVVAIVRSYSVAAVLRGHDTPTRSPTLHSTRRNRIN